MSATGLSKTAAFFHGEIKQQHQNKHMKLNLTQEQIEAGKAAIRPVLQAMLDAVGYSYAVAHFEMSKTQAPSFFIYDGGIMNSSIGTTPQEAIDNLPTKKSSLLAAIAGHNKAIATAKAELAKLEGAK
jgi:hypothetical protein